MKNLKKILTVIILVSFAGAFSAIRFQPGDKSLDDIDKKHEVKAK
jgi:hypothetical protein